jgi:hypothetical protein
MKIPFSALLDLLNQYPLFNINLPQLLQPQEICPHQIMKRLQLITGHLYFRTPLHKVTPQSKMSYKEPAMVEGSLPAPNQAAKT